MTTFQFAPRALGSTARLAQAKQVGDDLVAHHGKRTFYSVREVQASQARCGIDADVGCWSLALFSTHFDFDRFHAGAGHVCDYLAMKREMLASLSTPAARTARSSGSSSDSRWFDFDLSWIEFPDLDWSVGSSRVDLQACKLEYSIVSPK